MQHNTTEARDATYYAFEEARRMGEDYVSTEHILLGLLRSETNSACRMLREMNVPLIQLRADVERNRTISGLDSLIVEFTPRARRVIALAEEEARLLEHPHTCPAHLLLGLIREGEGLAARVLAQQGVRLEQAREKAAHITLETMYWEENIRRTAWFRECWNNLSEEQHRRLQGNGIPFRELPAPMQEVLVNAFGLNLPVGWARVDNAAPVRIQISHTMVNTPHAATIYTIHLQAECRGQIVLHEKEQTKPGGQPTANR